jgi:hypothetical protein
LLYEKPWKDCVLKLRPGKLFFKFVVGTCIKRLLLGANEQIWKFEVDILTSAKIFEFNVFSVFLTVRSVGEIFFWKISWRQSLWCAESRSVGIFRISLPVFEI